MTQITILLVEDNKAMLDGMKDLLEISSSGYDISVLPASDGRQALALMADRVPDLIVSDVMMPNMGGYEFLSEVRRKPEWRHIPFIFVTAKGEKEDKRQGKLSDADLYITKPFVVTQLLELIRIQLDRTRARRQTQQQMADSLKKDLLQILNHEFRTPLTYVTAYYEMLADNALQAENGHEYSEYLRGIQAGNVRLSRLVEDFITVMELRSGEAQEKFYRQARPVEDVALLLKTVVNERREEAAGRNVQIALRSPSDLPPVFGSRRGIQNIFERILDNAVKFTAAHKKRSKETGRVTITATAVSDELRIVVQDEGVGIPPSATDKIFDLFVQHNRSSMEQQGAGIGLTVAQKLVELHRGRIEVTSCEGCGSAFTIILPVYTGDSTHFPGNDATRNERKQANVLIVEDNPLQRDGLEDLLETYDGRYQFNIRTAVNGLDGLAQISQTIPDLIISDIMMPQMDGYQFLQAVRENPEWQHIPFIFLTAKGEKQDEFEGFRRGVDEYVVKPYDSDDMIRFVTKQLDKHFHAQMVQAQTFNELKRSIINLITPEFRQPLDAVSESSQKLAQSLQKAETDQDLKQSLEGIYAGSIHLSRLIENMIALAELHTGETKNAFQMRAVPVANLGALLYETCQMQMRDLHMQGWPIHCQFNEDLPPVFADITTLFPAIRHLVELGATYCKPTANRAISLLAEQTDEQTVTINIQFSTSLDEEHERLFTELLAIEMPEWSEMSGPATKLLISKGYVALHNGRIQLTNDDGLNFTIALPIHQPADTDGLS